MKYLPMSTNRGEKGTDVALAVDAMGIGLTGKIDIAVIVSGDGDFVPLTRELMKNGIRVAVAYFDYEDVDYKAFANERLLAGEAGGVLTGQLPERRPTETHEYHVNPVAPCRVSQR